MFVWIFKNPFHPTVCTVVPVLICNAKTRLSLGTELLWSKECKNSDQIKETHSFLYCITQEQQTIFSFQHSQYNLQRYWHKISLKLSLYVWNSLALSHNLYSHHAWLVLTCSYLYPDCLRLSISQVLPWMVFLKWGSLRSPRIQWHQEKTVEALIHLLPLWLQLNSLLRKKDTH